MLADFVDVPVGLDLGGVLSSLRLAAVCRDAMMQGGGRVREFVDSGAGIAFNRVLCVDNLPLEELPQLYAQAVALEKHCRQKLEQVSQDIQKLDPDAISLSPWQEEEG